MREKSSDLVLVMGEISHRSDPKCSLHSREEVQCPHKILVSRVLQKKSEKDVNVKPRFLNEKKNIFWYIAGRSSMEINYSHDGSNLFLLSVHHTTHHWHRCKKHAWNLLPIHLHHLSKATSARECSSRTFSSFAKINSKIFSTMTITTTII